MKLSVRNVDEDIFKRFKAWATKEGITVGKALNLAMMQFMNKNEKKKDLTDFEPWSWGTGTENSSEEVDKVVYDEEY